ncbi:MAG: HPr-rel-A system PqqD family peptide chaperone [Verrucomicrobia bacterium]|nr:HPr-rel-A system PqqD family peptide chaperone [Verrucomicrobiota bacterium]
MMQKLSRLAVSAEGFVFNPASGDSFQVSATGLRVLNALREGQAEDQIAHSLAETYQVELEDARRDVAEFCAALKSFGLTS